MGLTVEMINVQMTVNGQEVRAVVPSDLTLMKFLREWLGLTGTKDGCAKGHCGSCTVIMNGKATRSCLVKISRADGAKIETIEGLSVNDDELHPLQYTFIKNNAVQCGFCTPGMILTSKALLDANPNPSDEDIKGALTKNRNTCRCTGYVNIIRAVRAAGEMIARGEHAGVLMPEGKVQLSNLARDAVDMVTGKLLFAADMKVEGMVHGKIRWADHPYAEILKIDTSEAEAVPGVVRVITARDIPGKNQAGIIFRDQPAIADKIVRFIGEPVAAVYAETEEAAEEAVARIKVDYKVLQGVFSPEEAMKPDAPKLHEKGNLLHKSVIERGDVDEAFERSAVVLEDNFTTPFIEHGFIEPEAGLGFPGEDGGVTVKMGVQSVFDDRTQLCEILNLPEDKVRVIQLPIGGAFGGKEDMILQQFLALGALLLKRPVKMVLSREESLRVHVKRHPTKMYYKIGADAEGHVLALQSKVISDTGIYASLGVDIIENMVVFGAGPYYVPNLKLDAEAWYTNNIPSGAMRGFGVNQIAVALEQMLDEVARRLKIDPFEIRLINGLDVGLPSAADHIMEKGVVSIKETVQAAWDEFKTVTLPAPKPGKKIGFGVASAVKNIGYGHNIPESAGAILELDSSGCFRLRHSQHEYGQGSRTALVRLVADVFEGAADNIQLIGPDTDLTPPTGPTTASRQTFLTGNATLMAARALRDEIMSRAAEILENAPDKLKLQGDRIVDPDTGNSIPLSDLGEKFVIQKTYTPRATHAMLDVGEPSHIGKPDFESRVTHWCYAYNTQVAVVEVDEATGEVKVLKVISANDLGKVLNRAVAESQIHGGVMMGLGMALSEEFIVEKGVNLTDSLHKVRLPTAADTPDIIPVLVEIPHPEGPLGAKGFAEAPSLATAPAILNAIYDATGVRIKDLPADKKRVLAALQAKQTQI